MYKCIACVMLLLCTIKSGFSMYFQISKAEKKCFIEKLSDDSFVLVNYKIEFHNTHTKGYMPSPPIITMRIDVHNSDHKLILSHDDSSEGRIFFVADVPGNHVICLYPNSTAWFEGSQMRVHVDIQIKNHTIGYVNAAEQEKLMQLRIRQLLDKVDQINDEHNYQRIREERFRNTSESTQSRVLWCSVIQIIIFVTMMYQQKRHLKIVEKEESEKQKLLLGPCTVSGLKPGSDLHEDKRTNSKPEATIRYGIVAFKSGNRSKTYHSGLEPVHSPSPLA